MNPTDIVTTFRDNVPAADPDVLMRARDRLLSEAVAERVGKRTAPRSRSARRWRLAGATAAVTAAALVAAGLVARGGVGDPKAPEAVRDAAAIAVLERAALAAQALPVAANGSGKFVFVESTVQWSTDISRPGVDTWSLDPLKVRRAWLSADGRSTGLASERLFTQADGWQTEQLSGCRDGHSTLPNGDAMVVDGNGNMTPYRCTPNRAYHDDLPTTTDAMVAYLHDPKHLIDQNNPGLAQDSDTSDQGIFLFATGLLAESYIPPAALAALFRAMGRIPGVTVDDDVVDASGRHGVAVGFDLAGSFRDQMIFDPRTYAFLGTREVALSGGDGLAAGALVESTAVNRVAIVDRAGALPGER